MEEPHKINTKLNSSEYSTNSTYAIKPNYIICPKCKEIKKKIWIKNINEFFDYKFNFLKLYL